MSSHKHSAYIILFHGSHDSVKWAPLLVLFYKNGNQGAERFRNFFKVTKKMLAPLDRKSGRFLKKTSVLGLRWQKFLEAFAVLCV